MTTATTLKKDPRAATSRTKGAVGRDPLVYRAFREITGLEGIHMDVLDFGAGKDAVHTRRLRELGYEVRAKDLPEIEAQYPEDFRHKPGHLYDVVLMSNVLNVQENTFQIRNALVNAFCLTKSGGMVICNYPVSPRKSLLEVKDIHANVLYCLGSAFHAMHRIGGTPQAPIWAVQTVRSVPLVAIPKRFIKG